MVEIGQTGFHLKWLRPYQPYFITWLSCNCHYCVVFLPDCERVSNGKKYCDDVRYDTTFLSVCNRVQVINTYTRVNICIHTWIYWRQFLHYHIRIQSLVSAQQRSLPPQTVVAFDQSPWSASICYFWTVAAESSVLCPPHRQTWWCWRLGPCLPSESECSEQHWSAHCHRDLYPMRWQQSDAWAFSLLPELQIFQTRLHLEVSNYALEFRRWMCVNVCVCKYLEPPPHSSWLASILSLPTETLQQTPFSLT